MKEFLRQEYCIRCAERICMIQERIPNFHSIQEFQQAHCIMVECFQSMREEQVLDNFTPVVRSIVENGRDMVPLLCMGMARLVNVQVVEQEYVDTFLNEFLLNRIGSNVLMSQYLSITEENNPTSIVDPNCNVAELCRNTARAVTRLCLRETGVRVNIKVECFSQDENASFAFIPAALSYILQEVLKNSAVATAKQRLNATARTRNDDISVIVCADERRVIIYISDKAGGIPFDVGQHVWSWLYSTKSSATRKDSDATELGGFGRYSVVTLLLQWYCIPLSLTFCLLTIIACETGVGLPLSRLYANYLGGSINLVSLPNYGTNAVIFFPRLPKHLVENVPERAHSSRASLGQEMTKAEHGVFIV